MMNFSFSEQLANYDSNEAGSTESPWRGLPMAANVSVTVPLHSTTLIITAA